MNAIQKALSELRYRIPEEVLQLAFEDSYYKYTSKNISLDEKIRNTVIRPRVLVDCNLLGGTMMTIPVDKCTLIDNDLYTYVYFIPKDLTDGKSIISALDIVTNIRPGEGSSVVATASRMADSYSGDIAYNGSARLELIAENTVLVRRALPLGIVYFRVRVGNDENLSNIDPRSYPVFSELVSYAVKSYIYNKLRISINTTNIMGGFDSSRLMDVIDSYSDAEELYQTTLREKWGKVAFCNDTESHARYIKMQISPGL